MTVEELKLKWVKRCDADDSAHDEFVADLKAAGFVGMFTLNEFDLILDLDGANTKLLWNCLFIPSYWRLI